MQLFYSQCRKFGIFFWSYTPSLFIILLNSFSKVVEGLIAHIPQVAAKPDIQNHFLVNLAIQKKTIGEIVKDIANHHHRTRKGIGPTKKKKTTTTTLSLQIRHQQVLIGTTLHLEVSHLLDGRNLLLLPRTGGSAIRTNKLPVWIPKILTTAGPMRHRLMPRIMVADTSPVALVPMLQVP